MKPCESIVLADQYHGCEYFPKARKEITEPA
jgi:hypothetical protein